MNELEGFVLDSSGHKDGQDCVKSLECYMNAKFKQGTAKHGSGSRSGHKDKINVPNNESLHSHDVTRVLGVVLGAELDGATYFTMYTSNSWAKNDENQKHMYHGSKRYPDTLSVMSFFGNVKSKLKNRA